VNRLWAGQPGFNSGKRKWGHFPVCHRIQTGSGAHSAPYPMGTGSSFPGSKIARMWSWPFTSI